MSEATAGSHPESGSGAVTLDWRRGFEHAATGLDCLTCGARVGVRPDLTERHRRWHREIQALFASE